MPVMPIGSSKALKSDRSRIDPGAVVEYEQHGKPILAIVVGEKRNKWQILNSSGQELELDAQRLYLLPALGTDPVGKEARIAALTGLEHAAADLQNGLDLEELWQTVFGEMAEASLDDLLEILFPRPDIVSHLALRRALIADSVFFKRKKTSFEPRAPEIVEELKLKLAADKRRAAERDDLISALVKRAQDSSVETALPPLIGVLAEYAALGSKAERNKEAQVLLAELEERLNVGSSGRAEDRAFSLLVRARYFTADENLSYLRLGRPIEFSSKACAEAADVALRLKDLCIAAPSRRDLSKLTTLAIDSADTRDVDDALSIECLPDGYRIGIHISDAAAALPPGSTLEDEALRRATSVYCPDGHVPMLPKSMSEGALSLLAGMERCAVSFFIRFDRDLEAVERSVERTRLSVSSRLTYEQVDEVLFADGAANGHADDLRKLWDIVTSLERRRLQAGAVQFTRRELNARIGADGRITLEEATDDTPARKLVSELMILANETGALIAGEQRVPLVFRSQEPPDVDLDAAAAKVPEGPAREFYLRSLLKRSLTSFEPQPHSGLGLKAYAQFTSPIRRMVDLVNQRQLITALEEGRPYYSKQDLTLLLAGVEAGLDEAQLIQRERNRYFLLKYMVQESIRELDAVVVKTDGPKPLIELQRLCMLTLLNNARSGLRPGDRLKLRIDSIDPRKDILVLSEI